MSSSSVSSGGRRVGLSMEWPNCYRRDRYCRELKAAFKVSGTDENPGRRFFEEPPSSKDDLQAVYPSSTRESFLADNTVVASNLMEMTNSRTKEMGMIPYLPEDANEILLMSTKYRHVEEQT